ncbi:lasso RiPP family leader peptide-containing protein [Halapricum sp. CBA1109]|nr:lasso RiPP family leader peptide-containing protein [Halapricum sp. CBA1109]MUV88609.1 lasso RiPP family leader peptide-containing protein [Halapricum sp. CBA1109]
MPSKTYDTPEVTEYGSVETLTLEDKIGSATDVYSEGTPLDGSIVPDS